ncbi:DUF3783 domain-containing protein [Clostridium sp.]|uniref:DUF3783 domain-containing protein n=1 Tax=Clostridium sp. TaxID=1506 RepID=UPI003994BD46
MINEKKILVYGLDAEEMAKMKKSNIKMLPVNETMLNMKVFDILAEKNEVSEPNDRFKGEKILVFNAVPDVQLKLLIDLTKRAIKKKPILAVVTDTSIEWSFEQLIEHLIEEREWHKSNKKGTFTHEQE